MEHITLLIGIVIITALVFDFTNGFHDTANAMATTISTGALKPKTAVAMSAVLNLVGAFLSVEVAKTISGGILDESAGIKPEVIFAGLVGAIVWNLLTWLAGLPPAPPTPSSAASSAPPSPRPDSARSTVTRSS